MPVVGLRPGRNRKLLIQVISIDGKEENIFAFALHVSDETAIYETVMLMSV